METADIAVCMHYNNSIMHTRALCIIKSIACFYYDIELPNEEQKNSEGEIKVYCELLDPTLNLLLS